MEFTRKGHRLERIKDLIFRCVGQAVVYSETEIRKTTFILSEVSLWAPCTRGQVLGTVRAWAASFEDDELLERVDTLVEEAFAQFRDAPPAPARPSGSPPHVN